MSETHRITLTVNGHPVEHLVEGRLLLSDFLRNQLGLTGTHVGCEHGVCGACTIFLDGKAARSCLMFAVQTDGHAIQTIEGLSETGEIADLQAAFTRHHALQCGFCTPGMLAVAHDLLLAAPDLNREEIKDGMSAALCRCTGYLGIVGAVEEVAAARRSAANEAAQSGDDSQGKR